MSSSGADNGKNNSNASSFVPTTATTITATTSTTTREEKEHLAPSSAVAPQASLPQASSTSAEEHKQMEKPKPPPSIKVKFTLSTLSRKYDEGDVIMDDDEEEDEEEEEEGEEGEIEEGEVQSSETGGGAMRGLVTDKVIDDVKNNDEGIENTNEQQHQQQNQQHLQQAAASAASGDLSETTSSITSLNPKSDLRVTDQQGATEEDVVMEDNQEDESMESNRNSTSTEKTNGFATTATTSADGGAAAADDDDDGEIFASESKAEESVDAEMATGNDDEKSQGTYTNNQEKDLQQDAANANNDGNNRPTRTRSSYENNTKDPLNNDRESLTNEDTRTKDDASIEIDNKNEVKTTNTYSTTSRSALLSDRDNIGFRDPPSSSTNMTTSFLDSLSEEQRRVRTRHLPNISGFRRLHKSEIKRDVASIKKMLKVAVRKGGWRNGSTDDEPGNDTESMDVDGNVAQVSGEETQSDDEETSTNKRTKDEDIYNVFSLPFIQSPYICTDIDGEYTNKNSEEPALFSSPQVVESISAFNPPRPPESVGPKKMHRLHRWERNPQDVEVDLDNYRKTVNRTRQELHKAEMERERIEVVGAHLRSHFTSLLKCMRLEMDLLNQHYDATQIQCVKAAELLTSKTRSRGASRGSYVMKDVISVLKSRGEKLNLTNEGRFKTKESPWCLPGLGGVCFDQDTTEVGCGWILPGDRVSSPYGTGIVEQIYEPSAIDKSTGSSKEWKPPQSQMPQSHLQSIGKDQGCISSRVRVRLPFGVGYFNPSILTILDSSSSLNDEKLIARWMAMFESSKKMGTIADSRSVDNYTSMQRIALQGKEEKVNDGDDDLTESSTLPDIVNGDEGADDAQVLPSLSSEAKKKRFVSNGGGLLPLSKTVAPYVDLEQIENNVKMVVKGSGGVVGKRDNQSVPPGFRTWENNREELRVLEGQATQLRNKVYRQKRIRYLNERSCKSNKERSDRFELLLTEMKADLNILKKRLNEELAELGIDQSKAEDILADYEGIEDGEIQKGDTHGHKRKRNVVNAKSSRPKVEQFMV